METFLNDNGCRLILDQSKEALSKHLETNESAAGIVPMKTRNIHIVCSALAQFLEQNEELNNRNQINQLCKSVVRLMPDILMVKFHFETV